MGYAATVGSFKRALEDAISAYEVSDDLVIANDDMAFTGSVPYVKMKEITLTTLIYSGSKFRFRFDIRVEPAGGVCHGKIYKNGVAVGTEQDSAGVAYQTRTEDIDMGIWAIGDTVELWGRLGSSAQCRVCNFRMYGAPSQFRNTKTS